MDTEQPESSVLGSSSNTRVTRGQVATLLVLAVLVGAAAYYWFVMRVEPPAPLEESAALTDEEKLSVLEQYSQDGSLSVEEKSTVLKAEVTSTTTDEAKLNILNSTTL